MPRAARIPPGAFVGLLVGCLLAVIADQHPQWADRLGRVWPMVFGGWIAVYMAIVDTGYDNRISHAAFRLLAFVAMAGLIWRAANGFAGPVGRTLEWVPIVWLGTISYGLYLWHTLAKDMLVYAGFDYDGTPLPIRLTVASGATIAVAALSWYVVERPFLDLKRRHPYLPAAAIPADSTGPTAAGPVATGTLTS